MYQEKEGSAGNLMQGQAPEPISCCSNMNGRSRCSRFGIAALLIVAGLIWLAAVAGWFPGEYLGPMVLLFFGLWMFARSTFCGLAMTVMGVLWLVETAGHFHHAYFWPLSLTIMGILMFAASLIRRSRTA